MRNGSAKVIALGGILAALAVVIMAMGTLIPVATFVCPMLCMMILQFVVTSCGKRIAWGWYAAVALLSLLLAPDKEAAVVFSFLGYYPIVKPAMDKLPVAPLWKFFLFNTSVLLMYWLLANLFGVSEIGEEFRELGDAMTTVLQAMGNVTFFMLDFLLGKGIWRKNRGK